MSRSVRANSTSSGVAVADGASSPLTLPDVRPIQIIGVALLAVIAGLTQLDAIANTYLGWLPVSFFEALLVLLVGLAVLLLFSTKAEKIAPGADVLAIRLIAVLCLWMLVCFAWSEYRSDGLRYMVRAWGVMILPMLMPLFVRRPADMWPILIAMCGAGFLNGGIMGYETFTGARLFSTSYAAIEADFDGVIRSAGGSDLNPTSVSQMVMVSALLALSFLARGRAGLSSPIWLAVFVSGSIGVILASARSGIIGLGIGGAIVLFSFYRHRLFPMFLLGALLAVAAATPFLPESVFGRFAAITDFAVDRSLFRRVTYLRIGWDLLEQSPLWGVGPGNFPTHYVEDVYRYLPGRTLEPRELHNTYLDVAVEYGLVGFAFFAIIFGRALAGVIRAAHIAKDDTLRLLSFAVATAFVALLFASFFMPHKDMRYLWILAGLAMMCGAFVRKEVETKGVSGEEAT